VPQSEHGATYAKKLTASDQDIDWTRPASEIDAQIRGLSPFPGARFNWAPDRAQPPLRITRLQRPGKGPMDAGDFLRGTPVAKGTLMT
jgi:methionyl-tRNA formyltransferase